MAKKVILKDENLIEVMPITRAELVLDSAGNLALHSPEFLATDTLPGLMSPDDKLKLEIVAGNTVDTELSNTSTNPVQNKVLTQIINSIRDKYLKSAVISGNKITITDQSNNTVEFVNSTYQIVTNTIDGLVPKYDTVDGTIDTQITDWVLTNHNGTLGWYKLPTNAFKNDNTNTTYSLSGALSGNTYITTLTDSASVKTIATVPAMSGASSTAAGTAGLVPAPAANKHAAFLRGDGTWVVPTNTTYTFANGTAGNFTVTPSGGTAQTVSIGKPNTAGTADTAVKLQTARTLTIGNSTKTFDGSADVTWDLQSILLDPTTVTTDASWDITTPGVYKVASDYKFTGTNNPESTNGGGAPYRYGQLIVSRSGCGLALFYISHYDSSNGSYGIKYRTGYNNTYVSKWARILDSTNYNKYAPTLTGTGASGDWNINSATATKLSTSRKLWGLDFDGSADVNGDMTGVGTINKIFKVLESTNNAILNITNCHADIEYLHIYVSSKTTTYLNTRPLVLQNGYGNVGIGITLPTQKLEVDGNVKAKKFIGEFLTEASPEITKTWRAGNTIAWFPHLSKTSDNYAGDNTGFPVWSNANGILWLGVHKAASDPDTALGHGFLLGFSSNGRIYSRFFSNNIPTTANGGSWKRIAYSTDNFSSNQINTLTGYAKATEASSIAATDRLNTALGKLEYKADVACDWITSVTAEDTDEYINKWGEIVGFLDSVKEGTDITDEFVTRKTAQTITGLKTFLSNSSTTGISLILKNSGWDANMFTAMDFYNGKNYKVPNARIETKMIGTGKAGGTLIFYTLTKHDSTDPNPNGLTERLRIDDNGLTKITGSLTVTSNITGAKFITSEGTSSLFVKGDGSLDSNTYATITSLDDYLPLTGGKLTGNLTLSVVAANTDSPKLIFERTGSNNSYYDWLQYVSTGHMLFTCNNNGSHEERIRFVDKGGILINGNTVLHEGNYTSYLPFLNSTSTHATKSSVIYAPTTAGTYGSFLVSNGSGAPFWSTLKTRTFSLDDNQGRDTYLLIADLSNWKPSTTWDTSLIGTIYGHRVGNLNLTHCYNIVAQCTSDASTTTTWRKLYTTTWTWGTVLPYIVKYNDKNYLALKKQGSGFSIYFVGYITGLLSSSNYITLNVPANKTLPDGMEIVHSPSFESHYITTNKLFDGESGHLILHSGNYTSYLGYVGTTAVQSSSQAQALTGITNLTMSGNLTITSGNTDKYITFDTEIAEHANSWRIGYLGTGSGNANYFVLQSTQSTTNIWNNAIRLGNETLDAAFGGNVYPLVNNTKTLGTSDYRWSNIYSVSGNFSGETTIDTLVISKKTNAKHIMFSRGSDTDYPYNYIAAPTGGIISILPNGATNTSDSGMLFSAYGFHPATTQTYALGLANYRWSNLYSNTGNFSGDVTAAGFIKTDSSDSHVLLGGGGHKAISDFLLKTDLDTQELSANLTTITKTLVVSKDWVDTGIVFNDDTFPDGTGSYIVQLSRDETYYWTGCLSIKIATNVSRADSDEIILHGGGFDTDVQYYLRTVNDTTNKVIKLQIARSKVSTRSLTFTFKFKKLI